MEATTEEQAAELAREARLEQLGALCRKQGVSLALFQAHAPTLTQRWLNGPLEAASSDSYTDEDEEGSLGSDEESASEDSVSEEESQPVDLLRNAVQLVKALAPLDLVLRPDSTLCAAFMNQGPSEEWSAASVAWRMAQMRFLHNHTGYRDLCDELIDAELLASGSLEGVGGARALCDQAESAILLRTPWPLRWPWLSRVWTPENHATWHPIFREGVQVLVKCLWLAAPLAETDYSTRAALIERVVGMHASVSLAMPFPSGWQNKKGMNKKKGSPGPLW